MTDTSQNGQPPPPRFRERFAGLNGWWSLLHGDRTQSPPPGTDDHAHQADHRPAAPASLWRVRTTVPDEPGTLAELCGAFARHGVDIVSLQTSPLGPRHGAAAGVRPAEDGCGEREPRPAVAAERRAGVAREAAREEAMDEFVLRAPAELGCGELKEIVNGAGGSGTWAERADAHDLADTPTRVLHLATRTALDAAELPLALRQLLGRCTVRSVPPGSSPPHAPPQDGHPAEGTYGRTELRLPDPAGGTLVAERPWLPFTPAEFARAAALVELDRVLGAAGRVPRAPEPLTLADGRPVTVQRAGPGDLEDAVEMHRRCSTTTLRQRYHGPAGGADSYLRHLLSPRFGRSLAARTASGKLVALGHLLWDDDETEVALLVEDAWQHRGIGGELLRRLAGLAREAGAGQMYAVTQATNTAMVALMRKLGVPLDHQVEDGTLVISACLDGAGTPAAAAYAAPAQVLRIFEGRR